MTTVSAWKGKQIVTRRVVDRFTHSPVMTASLTKNHNLTTTTETGQSGLQVGQFSFCRDTLVRWRDKVENVRKNAGRGTALESRAA